MVTATADRLFAFHTSHPAAGQRAPSLPAMGSRWSEASARHFEGSHTGSTLTPNNLVLPRASRQIPRQTLPAAVSVYQFSSSIESR